MQAPVKAVVFDMGGVLVDWNPDYLYRKLIPDVEVRRNFLSNIINAQKLQGQIDAGVPYDDAARELLAQYKDQPEMLDLILVWNQRFSEMFNGPIQGSVDILAELHDRGVPLYGLTNWSADSFARDGQKFAFMRWFKDIVVSGVEKVKKPDSEIYKILLRRSGHDARELVFIDDRQENLEPAKKLGMQTIHFTTPLALRQNLQDLHLL